MAAPEASVSVLTLPDSDKENAPIVIAQTTENKIVYHHPTEMKYVLLNQYYEGV